MSSSSEGEKRKRCEPGCECGRHRRRNEVAAAQDGGTGFDGAVTELTVAMAHMSSPPAAEVSVLVPARLDRQRQDLWDFLRPRWQAFGYEIVEGTCVGQWCKADAVADACSVARGDILVVADADVWCSGVPAAVDAVRRGAPWAIPHYQVCRLTLPATLHVLSTGIWPGRGTMIRRPDGPPIPAYARRPYPGRPGGGIVVLRRETYEQIPPDPRFRGWGQEDESWALALGTLAGRMWRGTADLWHLWHDPAPRQSSQVGNQAGFLLHRRYVQAARQPARMRSLVNEFRRVKVAA